MSTEEMIARWYQQEAVDATIRAVNTRMPDGGMCHPIIVAPTGSGKSFMICKFVEDMMSLFPGTNVLVLSHVQDILEQDHDALEEYFDGFPIGLYSAGLHSRTIHKITVAGIQSVVGHPELFQHFNMVLIDECHMVNLNDTGNYRSFLGTLNAAYVGLTATHFRLGQGYLHEGENALFNLISYDMSKPDIFNRLVKEGYLAKLITKGTGVSLDPEGCKVKGNGEYVTRQLSDKHDRPEITNRACAELVKFGKNYKKWLVFAIDIAHAEHINAELCRLGINSIVVHSKMKGDRGAAVRALKRGAVRCVVNVGILTTGLDVPDLDLIAIMRATESPVFHVQTIGRGLRVFPTKEHCLVLDFAGNIDRLGPINNVTVRKPGAKKGSGPPPMKKCPECECHAYPAQKFCDVCGFEFVFRTNLEGTATHADVVQKSSLPAGLDWYAVNDVHYKMHEKPGKPASVQVSYRCGIQTIRTFICPEHGGRAANMARNWMRFRLPAGTPLPETAQELMRVSSTLLKPTEIQVDLKEQYPRPRQAKF